MWHSASPATHYDYRLSLMLFLYTLMTYSTFGLDANRKVCSQVRQSLERPRVAETKKEIALETWQG